MQHQTTDLDDADLDEMAGDGTLTHLPFVRAANEIKRRRAAERTVPPNILSGLNRYAQGIPPGDCLRAILEGDLYAAFTRADPTTRASMGAIVHMIRTRLPSAAHGSPEAVSRYLADARTARESSP